MVKVRVPEVPPPGVGVKTVTERVPAVAMSAAAMVAWSWVAETYVVGRAAPFQRTSEVLTNRVPVTVRVNAGPPAVVAVGARLAFVGTGLLMVRGCALETPLLGVLTVTWAIPAVAISGAGIAARTRAAET